MKSRMFVMSALVALTLAFAAVIPATAASSVVIDFEELPREPL